MKQNCPRAVLLFSGKRKSGKDYFTDILFQRMDPNTTAMIKISAPIKLHWSRSKKLDYEKLLGCGDYKEKYRQEMITWSESVRNQDYGYFCSAAIEMCEAKEKPIWIVSDVRRRTDLQWFRENYGHTVKTVHIVADDSVREKRGWKFTNGIDDAETECDLDSVTNWDYIITNNENEDLDQTVTSLVNELNRCLKSP